MFSIEGREVLIKAVAQAIPSYTVSIFRLSLALCNRLKSMISTFWWGAQGNEIEYTGKSGVCCVDQRCRGYGISGFLPF